MMEQRTPEWHQARLGKVTASRMADVIARTKSGWGASRKNYMADLVAERLTGNPTDSFQNAAMKWGTETEPQARAGYAFYRDVEVAEVGFIDHPEIAMTGASPDGLVGEDGLVELKCPNTATHIDTLLNKAIPDKYVVQMQWQMACAGREWCDFVSFDPRMPPDLQMFCHRLERDGERVAELEDMVSEFLGELEALVSKLTQEAA